MEQYINIFIEEDIIEATLIERVGDYCYPIQKFKFESDLTYAINILQSKLKNPKNILNVNKYLNLNILKLLDIEIVINDNLSKNMLVLK